MRLYEWQNECLEKWELNQYKGIVNVVTGAGKTVLAMAAVKKLEENLKSDIERNNLKVKIIVPKTFLVRQWQYALKEFLNVARNDFGVFMGTHKSKTDCKYMIYVINSARYSFTRHMMDDKDNPVLIIADECHHYGTAENSKIFDFVRIAPDYKYYALGLSATPYCRNYETILKPFLGKEIYRFTFSQALKADIISKFSILNIRLEFTGIERAEYDDLSDKLGIAMLKLKKFCPELRQRNNRRFFITIDEILKTHENMDVRELAQAVLYLSYKRKEVVYLASSRIKCVTDLVKKIDKNSKIIIFGERIEMADEIYSELKTTLPNEAGIYHSKMHKNIGKAALREFEDSQIRILISCRTLDEGLNVSDADVGIIVSSTSSTRQRIQRLGRVLRKKTNGRQAYFYYLYVGNTMEETDVFYEISNAPADNINIVDLLYDDETGEFTNPYYEELAEAVITEANKKSWEADKIAELRKNISQGVISCDWWMTEKDCITQIKEAATKAERNYYIAMLMMIRARHSLINILSEG